MNSLGEYEPPPIKVIVIDLTHPPKRLSLWRIAITLSLSALAIVGVCWWLFRSEKAQERVARLCL